ncbi:MAG: PKD domain-containing protein [Pyrinomonadaceae bacterium]
MSIKHCRIIFILLALIVGGAVIPAPTISAGQDTSLDDKLTSIAVSPNVAATTLPVLWTAGGLSSGNDSAGQAARMTTDTSGNIAIVSGPAFARSLAVTSYTAAGTLRWQRTVDPVSGTFAGVWIEAAPNGDFVAVGRNVDSSGRLFGVTIVRYGTNGTLQWRIDSTELVLSHGRLVVDSQGNAYLNLNSTLYKYSPTGTVVWSTPISTFGTGAALSPDGADLILTGASGGNWRIQAFDTFTGISRWLVVAPEGISANDVIVDNGRVYVTGQGYTGASTPALAYFLTVVAYDQATGARLWRKDKKPADAYEAAGLWMAKAPDGSFVVTGQASRGFLDWYTVTFETTGAVRWEAVRDGGLNTDEIPRDVLVLANGTTVVTGPGGPNLPGGYIQGVTAGYSRNGTLLWEGFSRLATVWAAALPSGDVCATGGYDALITCFQVPGIITPIEPVANISASPLTGTAPLDVSFDGSGSTGPNALASWNWNFGDGSTGTGVQTMHTYTTPGTYTASLVVTDIFGLTSLPRNVSIVVSAATMPASPTNLTARALSRSSIGLTWTNGSTNQTGLKIERCQGSTCTNFSQIATVLGNATTYTNSGLAANTTYRYRVRAYNSAGNSQYSNIASARTLKR